LKAEDLQRKLKTLRTHPIDVFKKYTLLTINRISSHKREFFTHNYEKFFKVEKGEIVIDAGGFSRNVC